VGSMATFSTRTFTESTRVVVAVTGDCDLTTQPKLTAILSAAVDSSPVVMVDLSDVGFFDSSGIHALVTAHQKAEAAGHKLYLTGAKGVAAFILEITGLAGLLAAPEDL
jgi:anti-sigma B factor antagonist